MALADISIEDLSVLQPPRPRTLEELDHLARLKFAEVTGNYRPEQNALELLRETVRFLEQRRAIAGISEALEILGIQTVIDFQDRANEVIRMAHLLTRINPIAILVNDPEFANFAKNAASQEDVPEKFPDGYFENTVRAIRSVLEYVPIENLVQFGEQIAKPELGHRCRLSYDWLLAFVRRHTSGAHAAQRIAAQAYAEGRLSVDETASLLSMPRPDAVAWLEAFGYARDIQVMALEESSRAEKLAAIRAERLRRAGAPARRRDLVERETIATQRIEDVDARPWIPQS